MAYEIFLEDGKQLDLPDEGNIAISYQVNNIGDVRNQRANFSNRIKIPPTKNNLLYLGFNNSPAAVDNRPYQQIPVRVIQDGEEIVANGLMTFRKSTERGFIEAVIYSGLIDFYSLIEGSSIRDLDLNEFNHNWTVEEIAARFNSVDGVCYPLINYGGLVEKEEEVFNYQFDSTQMFFSIYVKEIITKIFETQGIAFSGSFVDSEIWNKLILPCVQGFYTDATDDPRYGLIATGLANPGGAGADSTLIILSNFEKQKDSTDSYNELTGVYTFLSNVKGVFRVSGEINNISGLVPNLDLRLNSNTKGDITPNQNFDAPATFSFETEEMIFTSGEQIAIKYDSSGGISIDLTFEFEPSDELTYGRFVRVPENLPDIDQKDFLKDIASLTGLILEENDDTREVKLRFFDDIETNKPFAVDWSDKLDVSKDPSFSFNFGFAQKNYFKYNNDDTIIGTNFARGEILVNDTTLKVSKDAATVEFSASNMRTTLRYLNLAQIPVLELKANFVQPEIWVAGSYNTGERVERNGAVYEAKANTSATPSATSADWEILSINEFYPYEIGDEPTPRLLLTGRDENLVATVIDIFAPLDSEPIPGIIAPYFSLPEEQEINLDWESLLARYYKVYGLALDKTKVVTAYFYLKPEDIKNLDFLTPVYVSRFSSLFYINKIDQFIRNRSTKCTLIRI